MASNKLFVDTWGWVTFSSRRETHYHAVHSFLIGFDGQVYTSDYVLDETITLLYARYPHHAEEAARALMALVAGGHVTRERITDERFDAAWLLRQRYADKPSISFTDLTSMVVMHERNIVQILTPDAHFAQVGFGFERVPALGR